jgi:hypothetical protein
MDDDSDADAPRTATGTVNQNLTGAVQRYAAKKRVRGEQAADLEAFITVSSDSMVILMHV